MMMVMIAVMIAQRKNRTERTQKKIKEAGAKVSEFLNKHNRTG